jgi:thiol-disulfide isomerase/thioredoxin
MKSSLKMIFFCALLTSGCNRGVQLLSITDDVILIPSMHYDSPIRPQEGQKKFEPRSFLYKLGDDTVRLTIIDHNKNGKFNDFEDVFVVSSKHNSVPFFPFLNPNVTKYTPGMIVAYHGHVMKIQNIEENGSTIKMNYLGINNKNKRRPAAKLSHYLDDSLSLIEVNTGEEISISTILNNNSNKLAYFHFWWTACVPCFDEIPYLLKLEQEGVLVINLANKDRESHDQLMKTIAKHSYPGLHFYGTPELVREFSQNGFPFGTLIEVKSGKKLIEGKQVFLVYEAIKK